MLFVKLLGITQSIAVTVGTLSGLGKHVDTLSALQKSVYLKVR